MQMQSWSESENSQSVCKSAGPRPVDHQVAADARARVDDCGCVLCSTSWIGTYVVVLHIVIPYMSRDGSVV